MVALKTNATYRAPKMNLKMKGLLKGLRYISHIFDEEDKKVEMRIGFPTDVKHVTHLGHVNSDSTTTPSWMNEIKQANGSVESDILQAIARSIEVLSGEESVGSSSRKVIVKTKLGKESSKPTGTRRNKDCKPIGEKEASSNRANGDSEAKPKKTRRRRKKKKKVVDDGSATFSSTKSVSSKPPSVPLTEGKGSLDRVKSGQMYMSAHESSDNEGSMRSYRTVASVWGRDVEEDGEKMDII